MSEATTALRTPAVRVAVALLLPYALSVLGAAAVLPGQPEHEMHLFLAHHYAGDYFQLWDPRWYGGFEVTAHPPLIHQVTALLAKLPGLTVERAYALLLPGSVLGLMLGVSSWSSEVLRAPPFRVILVLGAYPFLYLSLLPLGQLPFVAAVAVACLAAASIARADVSLLWAATGALLGAASATLHPLGIVITVAATAAVVVSRLLGGRSEELIAMGSSVAFAVVLSVVALWPFWSALVEGDFRPVQLDGFAVIGNVMPGLMGGLIALLAVAVAWSARPGVRVAMVIACGLLGLGALGGLPGIGGDKLIWIGGALTCVGLATVDTVWETREGQLGLASIFFAMLIACAWVLGRPPEATVRHHRRSLTSVVQTLNKAGDSSRYVTVGVGPERLELGRRMERDTLDGGMPWAKSDSPISETAFLSLDGIPLDKASARKVLRMVLQPKRDVRWVVSANPLATNVLEGAGFGVRQAWRDGVVLWEREGKLEPVSHRTTRVTGYWWGLLPPMIMMLGIGVGAVALVTERQRRLRNLLARRNSKEEKGSTT